MERELADFELSDLAQNSSPLWRDYTMGETYPVWILHVLQSPVVSFQPTSRLRQRSRLFAASERKRRVR